MMHGGLTVRPRAGSWGPSCGRCSGGLTVHDAWWINGEATGRQLGPKLRQVG